MLNIHAAISLAREMIGRRGLGQFVHWRLGVNPIIDLTSDGSDFRRLFAYYGPPSEVVVMTVYTDVLSIFYFFVKGCP